MYQRSPRLSKIISPKEIIAFDQNYERRADIANLRAIGWNKPYDSYSLKEIKIYERIHNEVEPINANLKKSFVFTTDYSIGGGSDNGGRLTLKSVQEKSPNGDTLPAYRFKYINPTDFPSLKTNYYQDYWGFYKKNDPSNMQDGNYLPRIDFINGTEVISFNEGGSDKMPDLSSVANGTLKRITYPTGGYTDFEYELHNVNNFKYESFPMEVIGAPQQVNYNIIERSVSDGNVITTTFDLGDPSNSKNTYTVHYQMYYGEGGEPNGGNNNQKQGSDGYYVVEVNGVRVEKTISNIESYSGEFEVTLNSTNNSLRIEAGYGGTTKVWIPDSYTTSCSIYHKATVGYSDGVGAVGGLRIMSVENFSNDGESVSRKEYSYSDGKIFSIPIYFYLYKRKIYNNGTPTDLTCDFLKIFANNLAFSGAVKGSTVGYSQVVEKKISDDGIIRTKHIFDNVEEAFVDDFPFKPISQREFLNVGKVLKTEYKDDLDVIKIEEYDYYDDIKEHITGFVAGEISALAKTNSQLDLFPLGDLFGMKNFNVNSYMDQLKSKTTTEHLDGGDFVTTKYYEYNDNAFVEKIISNIGSPDEMEIRKKYVSDFSSPGNIYESMESKMILTPVIEQEVYKNSEKVDVQKVAYKIHTNRNGKSFYVPDVYFKYNIATEELQPIANYTSYNDNGKISTYQNEEDIPVTIIWGYHGQYPVAKIENADYDENIFTQSQWQFINTALQSDIELENLETLLNKLRVQYPDALVTTYTYNKWGLKSQTEPNGVTTYYEYDSFGRLISIKDQDQKVIKYFEYNYFDQIKDLR